MRSISTEMAAKIICIIAVMVSIDAVQRRRLSADVPRPVADREIGRAHV